MNTKQTVVLASASAMAAGLAEGAVVYSGPLNLQQTWINSSSPYRQGVDIVTSGGTNDFAFGFEAAANKPYVDARTFVEAALPYQSGILSPMAKANGGLPVTGPGTTINAAYAAAFPPIPAGRAYFFDDGGTGNQTGDWSNTAVTEGYVGTELALSGGTSFGWLHFIDNPIAATPTLTLVDWAYESSPGVGILIVPEPSSLALGGLGIASWLLLRKRKEPV